MHNKKVFILTFAFLMPLNQALWAEQVGSSEDAALDEVLSVTQDESAVQTESIAVDMAESDANTEPFSNSEAPPTEVVETTEIEKAAKAIDETAAEITSERSASESHPRDHWKAREEQYQALRKRAEEVGVMLPARPPWYSGMGHMMRPSPEQRMAHREEMMSMTAEERDAYRKQRYEEVRARAEEMGVEMPQTPPWKDRQQAADEAWAKHQKVFQGMSDEEREACHAMHRRHMRMMHGGRAGRGCGAMGHQGCGMHQDGYAPRMMPDYAPGYAPGYGYGPTPYKPFNFWDPNQ
jgi:hypothetical protein